MENDYVSGERACWLCGKNGNGDPLELHHIFGGAMRSKSEKYGWHKTTLSPGALEFVQSLGKQGFTLVRPRPLGLKGSSKGGGSSSRKYVCPCCRAIIRATKEVRVICADCDCEFQEEI